MKRDVKGYVRMVKEQQAKQGMVVSTRRGGLVQQDKKTMLDFVKLTLSNKLQLKRSIVSDNAINMECKLRSSRLYDSDYGYVRYAFGESTCKYEDWLGNEFDFSQSWMTFKTKQKEKEDIEL